MERFLKRHQDRIQGIITGFDRILFRGSLRSIGYLHGMDIFLSSRHVLYKNFGAFAERLSNTLKAHAEKIARKQGRPFQYLYSSKTSKEDRAREIMKKDRITSGLICVLSCVEPCQSFSIRRDRVTKTLTLKSEERKCLHLYFYYVDREFGFPYAKVLSISEDALKSLAPQRSAIWRRFLSLATQLRLTNFSTRSPNVKSVATGTIVLSVPPPPRMPLGSK